MKEILWNQSGIGTVWVLSVSFLVLLLLVLIEIKKRRKKRLAARIFLLLLIIASSTLIFLNPHFKAVKSNLSAVLLTENYSNSSLDSLTNIHQNRLKVFSISQVDSNLEATRAVGISQIAYDHPEIDSLYIIGDALNEFDENFVYPFKIIPVFNPLPNGIIDVQIPHEVSFHGDIIIKGKYQNDTDSLVMLLLEGAQGIVDSTLVPQGISYFTLVDKPKASGNFLYSLIERKYDTNRIVSHQVPFTVQPFEALNIAFHLNSPSFEVKFLKNWLGSLGHQLALKTRISLNIFNKEIINGADESLLEVTLEALKDLDVIIIDGEVLRTLSNQKLQLLENAVVKHGLGVLILGNESIIENKNDQRLNFFMNFNLAPDNDEEVDYEKTIKGKNIQGSIKKLPYQIKRNFGVEILTKGLMAQRNYGLGKVGLSLVSDSYSLNLSGKDALYGHLWSEIISELLPNYSFSPAWKIEETLNFKNNQVDFQLINYAEIPTVIITNADGNEYAVSMIQNSDHPGRWSGKFWPSESSWYHLRLENNGTVPQSSIDKWFFVQDDSAWLSFYLNKAYRQFMQFNTTISSELSNKSPVVKPVEVNRIYFFAFFLLSCGLLWIEQKL